MTTATPTAETRAPRTERFLRLLSHAAVLVAVLLGLSFPGRHLTWLLVGLLCLIVVAECPQRLARWVLLPAVAGLAAFSAGLYLQPDQSHLFGYLFHLLTAITAMRLRWSQALGLAGLAFLLLTGAEKGWAIGALRAGYTHTLVDLAGFILMTVLIKELTDGHRRISELNRLLERQATTDELTGLLNHRALMQRFDEMLAGPDQPMALVMLDLDRFKQFNDSYGHQAGDQVLRHLGAELTRSLPPGARAGRYGGDEFMVLLPSCGRESARAWAAGFARRLAADALALPGGQEVRVTASFGVAVSPADGQTRHCVHTQADIDLYRSKAGRALPACVSAD